MPLGIKIDPATWDNYPVTKGDRYELVFSVSGILAPDKIADLMASMKSDVTNNKGILYPDEMKLVPIPPPETGPLIQAPEYPTEINVQPVEYELHIIGTVKRNPIMLGMIWPWVVELASALLFYLSIRYIYLIGKGAKEAAKETPKTVALGFLAIIALAVLGILVLRKFKI